MRSTAPLALVIAGCTGGSPDEPPGSGADSGCSPGDTRVCIGEGACDGGQACLEDRTWGACDCGDGDTAKDDDTTAASDDDATSPGDDDTTAAPDDDTTPDPGPTTLDLNEVTLYDNPADLASWPITTEITLVEFADHVHVSFSKQDGEDRWPDVVPPGWDGPLQYTLGLAESIDGQWYGSAAIQFWYGLYSSGGNVALDDQIAVNWYYDSRWGELAGRQPETGETVGVFVVAGNVRGVTDGSQSPVPERSNVVLVPFPDVDGATYTFE